MGWILLVLLLIAAAFGVLGLVVKATIFIVLTVVISTILLAYIVYALVKRQARKAAKDLDRRLQPPSQDYRY
jgi:peptidoglycan/LPS O-acetylase OafA/YrhL